MPNDSTRTTYAAMVDRMDRGIGRVLDDLKQHGDPGNTLIIFTSDNGACAEWDAFGFDNQSGPTNRLHRGERINSMGSDGTFHSAGSGWAGASNTPWRLYKHYNHEGGIAVPCIIVDPRFNQSAGQINATPSHLIDVMPTILAAAGAEAALPGVNLLPLLQGESIDDRQLFFEHEGNRAVRDGQ